MILKKLFSQKSDSNQIKENQKPFTLTYEVEKDGVKGLATLDAEYPLEAQKELLYGGYTIIKLVKVKENVR